MAEPKRPHEETWVTMTMRGPNKDMSQIYVLGDDGMKRPFIGDERMRLAAQAPAMARELLALRELLYRLPTEHAIGMAGIDKVLCDAGVLP